MSTDDEKTEFEEMASELENFSTEDEDNSLDEDLEDENLEPEDESDEDVADEDDESEEGDEGSEEEEDEDGEEEDTIEVTDLPEYITEAATAMGLDNVAIKDLANRDYDKLQDLAFEYLKSKTSKTPEKEQPTEEEGPAKMELIKDDVDLSGFDEKSQTFIKSLMDNQNTLINGLNRANEELHGFKVDKINGVKLSQEQAEQTIDKWFDKQEIPEVGLTTTLSQKQDDVRQYIFQFADMIQKREGLGLEESLSRASKAYTGMSDKAGKKAEVTLRNKLNKQKQKLTARPGGRKTKKKFKNAEDASKDVMMNVAADLGMDDVRW